MTEILHKKTSRKEREVLLYLGKSKIKSFSLKEFGCSTWRSQVAGWISEPNLSPSLLISL